METEERVHKEKEEWETEKRNGLDEVKELRQKVSQGLPLVDSEMKTEGVDKEGDEDSASRTDAMETEKESAEAEGQGQNVEENSAIPTEDSALAPPSALMALDQDDDDAVEY